MQKLLYGRSLHESISRESQESKRYKTYKLQ